MTNPSDQPLSVNCSVEGMQGRKAEVVMRQVDDKQNNAVTGEVCYDLSVTEFREIALQEGVGNVACCLPPFGFACWTIRAVD